MMALLHSVYSCLAHRMASLSYFLFRMVLLSYFLFRMVISCSCDLFVSEFLESWGTHFSSVSVRRLYLRRSLAALSLPI